MSKEKTKDAIRSLSAHPRWPVLIKLLERRKEHLVGRLLAECSSDSEVIRQQGQAREVSYLLEQLTTMASSQPGDDEKYDDRGTALV